ncbi:MAG: YbjN domain-containing protein [Planctomycetaceae bacterium]
MNRRRAIVQQIRQAERRITGFLAAISLATAGFSLRVGDRTIGSQRPMLHDDLMTCVPADCRLASNWQHLLLELMMQSDMFTPEDVSIESLRAVFDAAMMETRLDSDGDIVVQDSIKVCVTVRPASGIRFLAAYGVKPGVREEAGHALCNRINDGLIVIRASMHGPTTLLLDWYLPVRGGIGRKAVVLSFRKFVELVEAIGKYDTDGIVS